MPTATSTSTLPIINKAQPVDTVTWAPSPYIHIGLDTVYNPHTDKTLRQSDPGYALLRRLLAESASGLALDDALRPLAESAWLVDSTTDLARRYYLKMVSLEAHTVCNQACYFCPVSVDPRKSHFMPTETYERIVGELAALGEPIEAVFMISYNEPTLDPRFVEQVQCLRDAGLPPATLTNGTGLTPERTDALVALGGLRYLSINISTLDRERYKNDRGHDHLKQVLRNLDYAQDKPLAPDMHIVVLGMDDETHQKDFEELEERFAGSLFEVKKFVANDRAGYLPVGLKAQGKERRLCGCDHWGSRPIHHLHITPYAKCILCCQDYNETNEVGDLNKNSIREVLEGDPFAQARRQVYGLEEAPQDFICNGCKFALRR
jgi:MoaA/NifB/PqqE/SkfB family radical SAM enzyme